MKQNKPQLDIQYENVMSQHITYITNSYTQVCIRKGRDHMNWGKSKERKCKLGGKKKNPQKPQVTLICYFSPLLPKTPKIFIERRQDLDRWREKEVNVLTKRCEAGKYKMSYQNIVDIFVYIVYICILPYTAVQYNTFRGIINFR